jgi:hypothetical protein
LSAKLWRLVGAIAICALPSHSASAATREAQVKAAYLFKLTSFVRWPPTAFGNSSEPLRICILGRADVHALLAVLIVNQQAGGHPITAVQIGPQSAAQVRDCHTLFVGRNDAAARGLMSVTARTPVLTITDRSVGTSGGVVEFLERDGNIRLAVRPQEAAARRLELSSKLMAVAEVTER